MRDQKHLHRHGSPPAQGLFVARWPHQIGVPAKQQSPRRIVAELLCGAFEGDDGGEISDLKAVQIKQDIRYGLAGSRRRRLRGRRRRRHGATATGGGVVATGGGVVATGGGATVTGGGATVTGGAAATDTAPVATVDAAATALAVGNGATRGAVPEATGTLGTCGVLALSIVAAACSIASCGARCRLSSARSASPNASRIPSASRTFKTFDSSRVAWTGSSAG